MFIVCSLHPTPSGLSLGADPWSACIFISNFLILRGTRGSSWEFREVPRGSGGGFRGGSGGFLILQTPVLG